MQHIRGSSNIPQLPEGTPGYDMHGVPMAPVPNKTPGQRNTPTYNANYTDNFRVVQTLSEIALNANPNRRYLIIQNNGGGDLYVAFGAPATTNSLKIPSGGNYEPYVPPSNAIHLMASQADTGVIIEEGV